MLLRLHDADESLTEVGDRFSKRITRATEKHVKAMIAKGYSSHDIERVASLAIGWICVMARIKRTSKRLQLKTAKKRDRSSTTST